jgi:hypothetical protein
VLEKQQQQQPDGDLLLHLSKCLRKVNTPSLGGSTQWIFSGFSVAD